MRKASAAAPKNERDPSRCVSGWTKTQKARNQVKVSLAKNTGSNRLTGFPALSPTRPQLLWVRHFETVEELRKALGAFAAEYNASWLRQRQGYKTPNQIRAEQKALEPEAATGVKMAA